MDFYTVTGIIILVILVAILHTRPRLTSDQKLQQIKDNVIMLDSRVENFNFYVDHEEAYILGKKDIYMCLRDKNGNYYDDNFLTYIAVHEVAHALIPEDTSKHPPIFDKTFDQLIDKARALKIYDPSIPFPKEYCNRDLKYY